MELYLNFITKVIMHIVPQLVVAIIPAAMDYGQNLSKVLYINPENAGILMIVDRCFPIDKHLVTCMSPTRKPPELASRNKYCPISLRNVRGAENPAIKRSSGR